MIVDAIKEAVRLILSLDPQLVEIVGRTLAVTFSALLVSALVGVPIGVWLALSHFPGRRLLTALIYTGMGLPPVVVGLGVYLLLSRNGTLGGLGWLFTSRAMVLAQIIIAIPPIIGVTLSAVLSVDPELAMQVRGIGATRWQAIRTMVFEARFGVILGLVAGFGAIISEVGAVMLVGGNIAGRTRVLTTAIVLETRKGNFDLALALGLVLLSLAFIANLMMALGQGRAFER